MLFSDDNRNTFKICFHRPTLSNKLWVCSEYVSGLLCSHNYFRTIEECFNDFTRFSTINKIANGFTQKYVIEILKDRYAKGLINVESGDGFLTNFTLSILDDIIITK